MIIRGGSNYEFFKYVAGRKIYIYGAGKNANEFLEKYSRQIEKLDVCAFIDNNSSKKDGVKFSKRILPVITEKEFIKLDLNVDETVLLLTMGNFWDVLESLDSEPSLSSLTCYIYPLIRLEEMDRGVYEKKMPQGCLKDSGDFLIPPIIHYCWFGKSELPQLAKKCIESWKYCCPDFEIRLWNEDNYDVEKNPYMFAAYKDKKWAYVSDYARVDVVNEYGGIYLDTDVELLRPLDMLMREKAFAGFESGIYVSFGLGFGAGRNNPVLCDLLNLYADLPWDGGMVACPTFQSKILEKHGLIRNNTFQRLENITILPARYLSPMSVNTGRMYDSSESFAVHHYAGSWLNGNLKRFNELKQRIVYGPF